MPPWCWPVLIDELLMSIFYIVGRCIAKPPPADWRERLAARLGSKPRRIGIWAELGLYGALECMASADEARLPAAAGLILSSRHGPTTAMRSLFEQAREDLPMPLTFLQTQPSQVLAALCTRLDWVGDARFIAHSDPAGLLNLAAAQGHREGILIGWVEDLDAAHTVWLRLIPCDEPPEEVPEFESFETGLTRANYLRVRPNNKISLVHSIR